MKRIAKEKRKKAIKTVWKLKPLHSQYPLRSQKADVDLHGIHQWLRNAGYKTETDGFTSPPKIRASSFFSMGQTLGVGSVIQAPSLLTTSSQGALFFPQMSIQRDTVVLNNIYTGKSVTYCDIETPDKWYEHGPLPVVDTPKVNNLWDFPIRADRTIQANWSDIEIKHKQYRTYQLIDMNVPSDSNISAKEFEKLSKYENLEIEIDKVWKMKKKNHTSYCRGTWHDKKGNTEIC